MPSKPASRNAAAGGDGLAIILWRLALLVFLLALWQWGFQLGKAGWPVPSLLDPYFISTPAEIGRRFLQLGCLMDRKGTWLIGEAGGFAACLARNEDNLWIPTLGPLKHT